MMEKQNLSRYQQVSNKAPYLFVIVLDYVMRQALSSTYEETNIVLEPRTSRRHPEIRLQDLDFADDIALLASTI